jgi:hypothetical protein
MKYNALLLTIVMLFSSQAFAQDWPNFAKYREQNAALAPPAKGEDRIVFMGNSITEGWSKVNPEFFEGKPYINRGHCGQHRPLHT